MRSIKLKHGVFCPDLVKQLFMEGLIKSQNKRFDPATALHFIYFFSIFFILSTFGWDLPP